MTFHSRKSFFIVAFGTMLEYYDMVAFIIFLPFLSASLFGTDNSHAAMVKGYLVLFLAALARPLGALTFGYIGDYFSRPRALVASMFGIAIATLVIGLTPSYTVIGPWAIVIVIAAKSLQAFCYGGEFSGAGIYVVEGAEKGKEAMVSSTILGIAIFGSLIAALFGIFLTSQAMPTWSWRLIFILGGCIGLIGISFRRKMLESPQFIPAHPVADTLWVMMKSYPLELLTGVLIAGLGSIPYTVVVTFVNPLLHSKGLITSQQLMMLQTACIAFSILALIFTGWLTLRFHAYQIMKCAGVFFILLYPILSFLQLDYFTLSFVLSFSLIFLTEFFFAPAHAIYKELFPAQFRYRGASFSFCLGISILAGLTPLLENYLYTQTNELLSIFLWIIPISIMTLFCLNLIEKRQALSFNELS